MRAAVVAVLCLGIAGTGGTYAFFRLSRHAADARRPQDSARPATRQPPAEPASPSGAPASAAAPGAVAFSAPDPTGADLALDDNGGAVERITGEYGGGAEGRRLIAGKSDPVWAWRGSALRDLPLEIVLSFYKRQPALITAIVIDMPPPEASGAANGNAPKDVEIWTSMDSAEGGFGKVAAATLTGAAAARTVAFPSTEARYVKIRVLSVQGPIWALSRVDLGGLHVLEAQRSGYSPMSARYPDLGDWKDSPRHAAQRGIDWLQPAAIAWQKDHNCFGCHIQAQAVMGLAIAKKNEYRVDDRTMKELADFTVAQQHADGSYVREDTGEPSTQFAAMQLAYWDDLQGIGRNPSLIKSVEWLLARQKPAGHFPYNDWLACGVRAVEQGSLMTTANSLVAFERAFIETHDARYRDAADRARAWIASTEPATTQDKVFKVLALARFGGPERAAHVQRVIDQLIVGQHPTGGWRECNDPSTTEPNPFSTGQVLYAFKQAGVSINSSPFIRGVKYLLATQNRDGSWPADAHAFHTSGAPHAASMWAIIGLAGSFGTAKTGELQVVSDLAPERAAARRNLEIILDLSGSMKQPLGASTRIETARRTLRDVLTKIPDDFNVGLRVYAHRYSARQKETCTDTELVSPIVRLDRARILSTADRLQPRGETPLVYSILQAPADLKAVGGGSLIVITDGDETCGGDPVKAAEQLREAGLPLTLNIVGFTLSGKKVEADLTAFAEATGGHYYSASDGDALGKAMTMAALTRIPYTVYDDKGTEVAKGIAGPLAEPLPAGRYKLVVQAGDQTLTDAVDVAIGATVVVQIAQRDGRFQLSRLAK